MENRFENTKLKSKCYHGTDAPAFKELDKKQIQKDPEDGDAGYFGWGFYLTTDEKYASTFGDNIYEFFVDIENPFTFDIDDYSDLIEFIFKDSGKHLHKHIQDTMYALRLVGRDDSHTEFPNENPRHLRKECLEIYNKYNKKDLTDDEINEIKDLYIKLAKYVSNWLNGVFMYFGKELFHYFTSTGYDGVIVNGGREVVVYETKQLQFIEDEEVEEEPVEETTVKEDLELHPIETPNWEAGADEYTNKVINYLRNRTDVSDFEVAKLYPLRKDVVWYSDYSAILYIKYKDLLEIRFYIGGEMCIQPFEDSDEVWYTVEDLEENGIYTDEEYYAFLNDNEVYDWGGTDENTTYFGFDITPLVNNPTNDIINGYDLNYDDMYSLSEIIKDGGNLDWIFDRVIPEFINDDCPEYFIDNDNEAEEEPIQEEVPAKKHITKEKLLKDVISTFGCLSKDELTDAVYILPNGKILDTKGSNENSQHVNVAKYISDKYKIKDLSNDGSKFMDSIGAIRLTTWIPAIIITNIPMTEKQEDTLYNILVKLQSKVSKDTPLMISTPDGSQQIEHSEISNPEDIITNILGYQVFGILTEKLNTKKAEMLFLNRIHG